MFHHHHHHTLAGAAAVLVAALTLATPSFAASDTAPAKPAAGQPQQGDVDPVEARIADLHDKLHITDAQTADWNAVAQTMRDNAREIEALVKEKRQNEKTMTAIDDMHAYEQIAQAHADGVKKLSAAFETFYASMSDEQKKVADEVFREHKRHSMRRMHH